MKQIELINKRKRNEKHFLQEDGTIVAKIYGDDVHYLKNGKYEEIDNTLVKQNDCYVNKSNDYKVSFKEKSKDSFMKLEKDSYYLNFKLKNSNESKLHKNKCISKCMEEVLYDDVFDGIDIDYQTLPTKVKETIILKKKQKNDISFIVDTNLKLNIENGEIIASNGNENIFTIEKPYMKDSNGIINNNITYGLNYLDSNYELDLILDEEWLQSPDTKYPVYIDPTIVNSKNTNSVYDTYIYPGDTGVDRNSLPYLKIGVERVNNVDIVNRALLKFDLPEIGTSSEIISAELILQTYYGNDGSNTQRTLEIHKVTTDWSEENATWEQMNDKYDERVETLQFLQRRVKVTNLELDENGQAIEVSHDFNAYSQMYDDITDLVKHWYKDTPNNGIMIKANPEIYIDDNYPLVYSKNNTVSEGLKPLLVITYRNQNGLESYLNYKTQSFTDGNTFLNTYNGNLVGVFNIGSTVSSKLPASVNLIYNTNDAVLKNNGFKFSLNQTVRVSSIDDYEYLEYEDEDGTLHYFYKDDDNGKYSDEGGLSLTIEKNDNCCYMTDKYGNKKTFMKSSNDIYYLTKIEDISLNSINITLDSNNRITRITDGNNLPISIEYLSNQTIVTSPDRAVTLNYNGNNITSIATVNGTTTFTYNVNNLISSITDVTGLKINYKYYEQKPYRIKKIEQYGLNDSLGNYFTVEYGFNTTSFTDNKGRLNTLIFNSIGNLLSTNAMPLSEDINNAYSTVTDYSISHKNKILDSIIPVKYVKNYLSNTNSENDNQYFESQAPQLIKVDYSTDYCHSGTRSVRIFFPSSDVENYVYNGLWKVPKGKYYTFSGYFKTDKPIRIGLEKSDGTIYFEEVEASEDFVRHDVTLYLDEDSDGRIGVVIACSQTATVYVDDIQLEEGEVANDYNCIDNSDFSYGLSGWELEATKDDYTNLDESGFPNTIADNTSEVFKVIKFNNDKNTALQINMNPIGRSKFKKTFPIKGKKGDVYNISFWMKNEGLTGNEAYVGNNVMIYFKPIGHDADYCILTSEDFVPNNKWQYYTFKYAADEDYESITLSFQQGRQANKMLITNLSFYKDVNTNYFDYDKNGNLTSVTNSDGRSNVFKYDKDNQLVSSTTPRGKNFKYEYDNDKTDLVRSAISSMGISNRIKYDSNNNPITTIISSKGVEKVETGEYKIRSKGTEKYIKAEYNNVLMEENSCSNTIWKLEKVDDKFKIRYSLNPSFFLGYSNDTVILSEIDNNNLFILEKNDNGSYHIKLDDKNKSDDQNKLNEPSKYIRVNNSNLEITMLVNNDYNFEFYFEDVSDEFIENDITYSEDGRFVTSITDSMFNKTTYENDPVTGLLISATNANNKDTNYTYNDKLQVTSVSHGNKTITYSYNLQNLLSEISQENMNYKFLYNNFLNIKKVMIGNNITLVENEYEENNGNLLSSTYGNSDTITYEYDEFDRIKVVHKMDKDYYYKYDSNGNLSKILINNPLSTFDLPPAELEKEYDSIIKYTYDNGKRIIKYLSDDFKIDYTYDKNDNVTNKNYKLEDINHILKNTFDKDDVIIKTKIDADTEVSYEYDGLGRLISSNINNFPIYNYKYLSKGNRTSVIVNKLELKDHAYSYSYDNLYNITAIYDNGVVIERYYYDDYNELIKEENYIKNEKVVYNYDNFGNLLTKVTTNMIDNDIINTDIYQYSNTNWKVQLTNYNGDNITYDGVGNPLTIGNNIKMSWINGKYLNLYEDVSKNLEISYEYDINGIRTSKTVNGIKTKYYLENSHIIFEQNDNNLIYYLYSGNDILGLEYNKNRYYYLKNLQGDIIGIFDSNYVQIVSYEYDSWGKILSIKDQDGNEITDLNHIGNINPFRYRSYYYDIETNLYYLNNRYYNPSWSRFLNADRVIGANMDILGYNLYAYCSNNPIMFSDTNGNGIFKSIKKMAKKAAKAIYDGVVKVISSIISVEISHTYTNSTKQGGILMNIESGNSVSTVTKTIGNDNSMVKVKVNINDNNPLDSTIGIGSEGSKITVDASFGLTTTEVSVGFKTSRDNTTSFQCGNDLLDIYCSYSGTGQVSDNISDTQFTKFNMNKIVPVAIFVIGPAVGSAVGSAVTDAGIAEGLFALTAQLQY